MSKGSDKPILVFANYWDADKFLFDKVLTFRENGEDYLLNLCDSKEAWVYNLDFISPNKRSSPFSFKMINGFLCSSPVFYPSYKISNIRDNETFKTEYLSYLRNKKEEVVDWINSLKPNEIYIMCGWENKGRTGEVLYKFFSEKVSDKIDLIFVPDNATNSIYKGTLDFHISLRDINIPSSTRGEQEHEAIGALKGLGYIKYNNEISMIGRFVSIPIEPQIITSNLNGIARFTFDEDIDLEDPPF